MEFGFWGCGAASFWERPKLSTTQGRAATSSFCFELWGPKRPLPKKKRGRDQSATKVWGLALAPGRGASSTQLADIRERLGEGELG